MKISFACVIFILSLTIHAEIFMTQESHCKKYWYQNPSNNDFDPEIPREAELISSSPIYGFSHKDLDIDFEKQRAVITIYKRVILGFDRPLFSYPLYMKKSHPRFREFINTLNNKIVLINWFCVDEKNNLVDFEI